MNDTVKSNTIISYNVLIDNVAKTIADYLANDYRFINVNKNPDLLNIPDAFKPSAILSASNSAPGGYGKMNKYVNKALKIFHFKIIQEDINNYLSYIDKNYIYLSLKDFLTPSLSGEITDTDKFLKTTYDNAIKFLNAKIVKLRSTFSDNTYFSYCNNSVEKDQYDKTQYILVTLSNTNEYLTNINRILFLRYIKTY